MYPLPTAFQSVLLVVVLVAATYGLRFRRIPNWLSLCGLILGFGLNIVFFHGRGVMWALEGSLLAFAIYLPLYLLRGMGAGDVKLMAAIGSIVGPAHWIEILLFTAILGGIAAIVLALSNRRLLDTLWNVYGILHDLLHLRAPFYSKQRLDIRHTEALRMPHGVTIALGSIAAVLLSTWHFVEVLP